VTSNNDGPTDILGLAPYGEALNTVAKGVIDGSAAFLGRICLPAAEEFGLYLRDRISNWRKQNLSKVLIKAESIIDADSCILDCHAHPRVVHDIVENSSWADDEEIQSMWAGLLASSCTRSGKDETNLMFIHLLSQLTTSQVRILNYLCINSKKRCTKAGLVGGEDSCIIPFSQLIEISGISDLHRIDRELDHLRQLELIDGGFPMDETVDLIALTADVIPSALGLQLYVKCQGSQLNPQQLFELTPWEQQNMTSEKVEGY